MKKIIILSLISSIIINAAEYPIHVINLEDIEHTISYEASEINNDYPCSSEIPFTNQEQLEIDPDPIPARVESI